MRRSLFAFSALFLLTACEPTVDGYVKNAKNREAKLRECAQMGVMAAKEDKLCQMAMEAQGIVLREAAGNFVDAITLQSGEEEKPTSDHHHH